MPFMSFVFPTCLGPSQGVDCIGIKIKCAPMLCFASSLLLL